MPLLAALLLSSFVQAEDLTLRSDGVDLPGVFEPAPSFLSDLEPRIAVLIHGSGPNDKDEDLTAVSDPKSPCLFFRDLSAHLRAAGLSVLRYDKRSFVYKSLLAKEPSTASLPAYLAYSSHPLTGTIADAERAAAWAKARHPKARVYLVGHSEGSYVALQVARKDPAIRGAALIGFWTQTLPTTVFEQTVYRHVPLFTGLDRDRDGRLSARELRGDDGLRISIRQQMPMIDRDKDGFLSLQEFKAGQLSNLLLGPSPYARYALEQAALPSTADILRETTFPVAIFNGEWDNQTPVYNARAVEIANEAVWKRPNLTVKVFKELGHALDKRKDEADLTYRAPDPAALAEVGRLLNDVWR